MTRNQMKNTTVSDTIKSISDTLKPISNTSIDLMVFDNNPQVIYPTMFDRWSLQL